MFMFTIQDSLPLQSGGFWQSETSTIRLACIILCTWDDKWQRGYSQRTYLGARSCPSAAAQHTAGTEDIPLPVPPSPSLSCWETFRDLSSDLSG